MALKKCLKTARIFLLEREYLRFIQPDPTNFLKVQAESKNRESNPEIIKTEEISMEERNNSLSF